ncbi:voltage-dependent anion-selective channel [Drosophila sulfurigaster albostrigata]|uniref:voltage-dependent anion-selective channel n=1 Tax=Drosophila sulfurigaster albostrigata TaxID=89887 RepID=UPI002D21B90F|nr:voltage-dependent anion-selective channel [Drosophila sulfurigaster albostrigata]
MAPPIYCDLGMLARNLFKVGYHPGLWQLECKTLTSSGIEFFTSGFANQDASKVMGSLQSKYTIEDYGVTLTERWNTENLLYGQIMQREKLAEGLMLIAEASIQPSSGEKSAKLLADLGKEKFNILGKIGLNKGDPYIAGSLVLQHNEFLGGASVNYATSSENLEWKLALGWTNEQSTLHAELVNAEGWLVSLFHKANDKFDVGVEVGKPMATTNEQGEQVPSDWNLGVGMIYRLEGDALIRAKINNKVELGLGYQQKLREGITVSISTILDCQNITDGSHKFGVGLSLQC